MVRDARLCLTKKHWLLWNKTLAEAPVRLKSHAIAGELMSNIELEPMSALKELTVEAQGPIEIPISNLPKKMKLVIEFRIVGPIRRIRRTIGTVIHDPKQLSQHKEDC